MSKKFTGAITALVTPFKKNGDLDISVLKKLVRFQLQSGIHGLVPCGSTGEAATQTLEEYELVVRTVVDEVAGKVPVIAGAGSNDTKKAVHLSQIAKRAGVDGLLHVTPYYNKPTPAGILAHFKAIAKAVNLPVILYNVPGRTGSNVSAETTLMIAGEIPQVVAVKEASGDIQQMAKIVRGAPSYFSVLSGDDAFTLPLMALGGDGCISVVANEVPKQFTKMVEAAREGNFTRARKIHFELLDLMSVNFIESNPIPVKTALSMMGKIEESFRLPLTTISGKNREVLRTVLKKGKFL